MGIIEKLWGACLVAGRVSAATQPATCRTIQEQANVCIPQHGGLMKLTILQFDELPNNSVLPGPAIPVGYKGLNWQSFIVVNQDIQNTSQPQLVPESPVK